MQASGTRPYVPAQPAPRGFVLATTAIRGREKEIAMDKDRIEGMGHQAKGAVKDAAGSVTGDKKMQAEGKAEKAAGKVQNAVGGAKDAVRDATD